MRRRSMIQMTGALAILAGVGAPGRARAADVLKLATLAPKASPWGQVLSVWEKAVKEKSGGRLEIQIFYNGAQGDEAATVAKMKSGQLAGAVVTAVGLGKIYKPILALQCPGLFASWAKLDKARDAMKAEFEKGTGDAGFQIAGWGDVGSVRILSKGVAVRLPDDIRRTKPCLWRDDAIQPVFYQTVGGVTPVPLNVPEVLPQLNTGAINLVLAPPLSAEQLQWASKLDTIQSLVQSYAVGALVFSQKQLDALPADLRQIVLDTAKVAANALTRRIRNEDEAAFGRIKAKLTVIDSTPGERAQWDALFKQVRSKLGQGTFAPELITKLEQLGR
jgi:TRAP-type transport system periplasmic protein